MKKETEDQIIKLTTKVLDEITTLTRYKAEELKKLYPFHAVFFPDEALPYAKQERSIVTKMGQSFYPSLAEIVAKGRYSDVRREYMLTKEIESAKINMVNKIVDDLRANRRRPDHFQEISTIFKAKGNDIQQARAIADLYIGDHEDGASFFEIKSPMPNLDVCDESKRKMLTFLVMMKKQRKKAQAWFGLTYNPYGEGKEYKWSFTKKIMDMDNQVLIGKNLWDKIGGQGTFEEILRVALRAKEMWRKRKSDQKKLF